MYPIRPAWPTVSVAGAMSGPAGQHDGERIERGIVVPVLSDQRGPAHRQRRAAAVVADLRLAAVRSAGIFAAAQLIADLQEHQFAQRHAARRGHAAQLGQQLRRIVGDVRDARAGGGERLLAGDRHGLVDPFDGDGGKAADLLSGRLTELAAHLARSPKHLDLAVAPAGAHDAHPRNPRITARGSTVARRPYQRRSRQQEQSEHTTTSCTVSPCSSTTSRSRWQPPDRARQARQARPRGLDILPEAQSRRLLGLASIVDRP